jgi:hypothetical protein
MSKTIFLEETTLDASNNFKDRIGRYSPKKVALRALELLMFLEMPLSDNNWRNYELSRNQQHVVKLFEKYISIPDDYFFSNRNRLHINRTVLYGLDYKVLLEDWLISKIIHPFFEFFENLMEEIAKRSQSVSNRDQKFEIMQLSRVFFQIISRNIIDPQIRDNLEIVSEGLASIFYKPVMNLIR